MKYCLLFQLFNNCIENSPSAEDLDERLKILLKECTETVYANVAR